MHKNETKCPKCDFVGHKCTWGRRGLGAGVTRAEGVAAGAWRRASGAGGGGKAAGPAFLQTSANKFPT